jgi:hypothetical protein
MPVGARRHLHIGGHIYENLIADIAGSGKAPGRENGSGSSRASLTMIDAENISARFIASRGD